MITRLFSTCQGLPRYNVQAMTRTERRLFSTWKNIRRRCRSLKCPAYKDYGARGINISDEFYDDFAAFSEHVGTPHTIGHTIDRIDNNRGYERGNMRWVVQFVQVRNRRNNINYEWEGKTHCLRDWATIKSADYQPIYCRWKRGLRGDALFEKPTSAGHKPRLETIMIDGVPVTKRLSQWARYAGISVSAIIQRYCRYGWRGSDLLLPVGQFRRGALKRQADIRQKKPLDNATC